MVPRVTHNMMTDRFLANLSDIFARLQRVHDRLTSGHQIQRPSEDPPAANQGLSLRAAIQLNDQYLRTIDLSKTWLEATEASLTTITEVVQRARELALQGANDTLTAQDRQAIGKEAEQLVEAALAAANTSLTNSYLFAGFKTTTQPFTITGSTVTYNGDSGLMNREIGRALPGQTPLQISINIAGVAPNAHPIKDILESLVALRDALNAPGSTSATVSATIPGLDTALNTVIQLRAENGAKINRFDFTSERLKDIQLQLQKLLSNTLDADTVATASEFAQEQTVYQAALKAGSMAIQPSLLDFLK